MIRRPLFMAPKTDSAATSSLIQSPASRRSTRLRDNKRNYRTRQKEYIADLERTVRDYRERGVQASKEIQFSAQRVFRENGRLRQLLRQSGIDCNTIEAWVSRDSEDEQKTSLLVIEPSGGIRLSSRLEARDDAKDSPDQLSYPPQPAKPCLSVMEQEQPNHRQSSSRCSEEGQYDGSLSTKVDTVQELPQKQPTPCKLATYLAANGNADVTRSTFEIDEVIKSDEVDGVECSKAYQMLVRFATTERKLETVALALENGCVSIEGKRGRCKVKNESLWKALDEVMD